MHYFKNQEALCVDLEGFCPPHLENLNLPGNMKFT